MKPLRFVLLYLPVITVLHLASCWFIFKVLNQYTPDDPTPIIYQKTLILGLVFPAVIYIIEFCHDLFTMGMNGNSESVGFNRFYFPLLEEGLKLAFLYVISSMGSLNFNQVSIFIFVYNSLCLFKLVDSYSPHQYTKKYQKFLHLYDIWLNQDIYKNKYSYQNKKDMERLFNSIMAGNGPEEYDSVTSFRSEDTLINQRISISNLPPTFNFKDQGASSGSPSNINQSISGPPSPAKSLPMIHVASDASENTLTTSTSSRKITHFKSCYDFVEKLYSVSPKNTYHLNNATAMAAFDPISVDEEIHHDDSIEVDPLADVNYSHDNIDEVHSNEGHDDTHFGGGAGGGFRFKTPGGAELDFGGGGGFDFEHGRKQSEDQTRKSSAKSIRSEKSKSSVHPSILVSLKQSISHASNASGVYAYARIPEPPYCPNKFVSFVNWFSWLLPPFLVFKTYSEKSPKSFRKEQFPLLKQKLSTYNMDRAFSISESSLYGSLENGNIASIITKSSGNYENFKYFVGYYFGYNLDSNNQSVCIDPCFRRFGTTIEELSSFVLIIDSINTLIWNSLIFVVIGNLLMNFDYEGFMGFRASVLLFALTIVLKLFKMNYLNSSEKALNLKVIIASETFINLVVITFYGVLLVTK